MAIKIPIISEFNPKGINAAKAEFATLQGTGSKAMFLLQRAAIPAAAAIGSIAAVIKPAIDAASDFQESTSKVSDGRGIGVMDMVFWAHFMLKLSGWH